MKESYSYSGEIGVYSFLRELLERGLLRQSGEGVLG